MSTSWVGSYIIELYVVNQQEEIYKLPLLRLFNRQNVYIIGGNHYAQYLTIIWLQMRANYFVLAKIKVRYNRRSLSDLFGW